MAPCFRPGDHGSSAKFEDYKVLVVGGGYGGCCCAARLKRRGVPFVIVDPKEFFHHNCAALRAAVFPDYAKKTAIPLSPTFGSSFVRGRVSSIDLGRRRATLSDGRRVDGITHLVLATGSAGPFPARTAAVTVAELEEESRETAREISKSGNIVIIGGGAVGVELAGEIRERYKDKEDEKSLTVLNAGERLLSNVRLGTSLQDGARSELERKGVKVRMGERVVNLDELTFGKHLQQEVVTTQGTHRADLVFNCTGLRPDTKLLIDVFGKRVDDQGRIRVSPELRVDIDGIASSSASVLPLVVFAVGDCCDTDQEKMAAHAQTQGEVAADNVVRSIQGRPLRKYKPRFAGMVVTVGKSGGVGVYNGYNLPRIIVSLAKGKSLFTDKFWGVMGQKMPK